MAPRWRRAGDVFDLAAVEPGGRGRRLAGPGSAGGRGARLGRAARPWRSRTTDTSWRTASAPWRSHAPRSGQDEAAGATAHRLERTPGIRDIRSYSILLPAMVRTALGIGDPELAERLMGGLDPALPLRRARPRRCQRRPHRGPRRSAGRRRCLRRCRRSLGAVRGRARAGVRAPRPGPMSDRALPSDRGRARPATRPRDLRAAPSGPRARRDRRAPTAGDRAQLVDPRSGQDLVKEPIGTNGTRRYACDDRRSV